MKYLIDDETIQFRLKYNLHDIQIAYLKQKSLKKRALDEIGLGNDKVSEKVGYIERFLYQISII